MWSREAKTQGVQPGFQIAICRICTASRTELGTLCAFDRYKSFRIYAGPLFRTAWLPHAFVPQMIQFVCMTTQALYLLVTG